MFGFLKKDAADTPLADTAGRRPTQLNLMEEIAKVRRVIQKAGPSGPHEVLLVLTPTSARTPSPRSTRV